MCENAPNQLHLLRIPIDRKLRFRTRNPRKNLVGNQDSKLKIRIFRFFGCFWNTFEPKMWIFTIKLGTFENASHLWYKKQIDIQSNNKKHHRIVRYDTSSVLPNILGSVFLLKIDRKLLCVCFFYTDNLFSCQLIFVNSILNVVYIFRRSMKTIQFLLINISINNLHNMIRRTNICWGINELSIYLDTQCALALKCNIYI